MKILRFTVPGTPQPLLRHRDRVVKRKGAAGDKPEDYFTTHYSPKKSENEEKRIWPYCLKAMHEQRFSKAEGAVVLFAVCTFRLPKSLSKAQCMERLFHTQKPDEDNLGKLLKDALKDVAWKDDCQIIIGPVFKTWSVDYEGYEVWIAELPRSPALALEAFRDLRKAMNDWLDVIEQRTFSGRVNDDEKSLELFGARG